MRNRGIERKMGKGGRGGQINFQKDEKRSSQVPVCYDIFTCDRRSRSCRSKAAMEARTVSCSAVCTVSHEPHWQSHQLGAPGEKFRRAGLGHGLKALLSLANVTAVKVHVCPGTLGLLAVGLQPGCLALLLRSVSMHTKVMCKTETQRLLGGTPTSLCVLALYSLRNARSSSSWRCSVAPNWSAAARHASDSSLSTSLC